jgi:aminoglycoside phosphotransferase (APT) family kinase protein
VLEEDRVLQIVRSFVPEAKKLMHVDETGGEARMYAIDGNIIFKVQRPHRLRLSTSLKREVFYLNQIAEQLPHLSVPRVLGYVHEGAMLEGIVMTRMPGTALRYTELTQEQTSVMLIKHGRALAQLHQLNQQPFLDSGLFYSDTNAAGLRTRYVSRFEMMLSRLVDTPENEKEVARKLIETVVADVPESIALVALHSNPYKEHLFINEDKSYSGVIDFGDAYISHPVNDLRRFNTSERKTLLKGYLEQGATSDCFSRLWDVAYAIDAVTNMLQTKRSISEIKDASELLSWIW